MEWNANSECQSFMHRHYSLSDLLRFLGEWTGFLTASLPFSEDLQSCLLARHCQTLYRETMLQVQVLVMKEGDGGLRTS